MSLKRTLLGLFVGLLAAGTVAAQASGALRWRAGDAPLGLQVTTDGWRFSCGPLASRCEGIGTVPLYAHETEQRSIHLHLTYGQEAAVPGGDGGAGMNLSVIGKSRVVPELGVYGRIGAVTPAAAGWAGARAGEGALSYGVGLRWDFSRSASAVIGWDSYDMRAAGGEGRDVRATSLGLQWRY